MKTSWCRGPTDQRFISIAVKSKLISSRTVEVGRLKIEDSEEEAEEEHNRVLANSLFGDPACFLSTLTLHLATSIDL